MKRLLVLSILVALFSATASAAVWFVDVDNASGTEDGLSWATAYTSIQAAVDAAEAAGDPYEVDEIWVAEGVYTAEADPVARLGEGMLVYGGFVGAEENLGERSWIDHETIVDGLGRFQCLEGAHGTLVDGFVVRNGRAQDGAGMRCVGEQTIRNCRFNDNHAGWLGGALYGQDASLTVANSTFFFNSALYGGAAFAEKGSWSFMNCTFSQNTAGENGGAVSSVDVAPTLTNCILWENYPEEVGRVEGVIFGSAIRYSAIRGGYEGPGNIDKNPLMLDAAKGDFRLDPTSPCIDTGTFLNAPGVDILGVARPQGAGIDMGAYECVSGIGTEGEGEGEGGGPQCAAGILGEPPRPRPGFPAADLVLLGLFAAVALLAPEPRRTPNGIA
ncbi:MAG TPA: right-handed parallel beta-helix repeat-containing protein [Candidatus Hydrogenedentes bacterium]|nr:right-handed parallel beta-helix repeat-containing protein [Candidatus Hydrogenedentota bacterium]